MTEKKIHKKLKTNDGENLTLSNTIEVVTRRVVTVVVYEVVNNVVSNIVRSEMTTQRKEYERYAGALVEDFQSKLDAITEVVVSTAEDVTSIKEWIKEDHYNTHQIINSRLNILETPSGITA